MFQSRLFSWIFGMTVIVKVDFSMCAYPWTWFILIVISYTIENFKVGCLNGEKHFYRWANLARPHHFNRVSLCYFIGSLVSEISFLKYIVLREFLSASFTVEWKICFDIDNLWTNVFVFWIFNICKWITNTSESSDIILWWNVLSTLFLIPHSTYYVIDM